MADLSDETIPANRDSLSFYALTGGRREGARGLMGIWEDEGLVIARQANAVYLPKVTFIDV